MTLIKCPRCGHSVLSVASLCPSCNATLGLTFLGPEHGGELAECRECGHSVRSATRICPNCGAAKPGKRPGVLRPVLGLSAILVLFVFVVDSWPKNQPMRPKSESQDLPKPAAVRPRPAPARPHADSTAAASVATARPSSESAVSKDTAKLVPPTAVAEAAVASAGPSVDSTSKAAAPTPVAAPAPPARDSTTPGYASKWTTDWVNVRERPADYAHVVRVLRPGTRIDAKARKYGWWLVFVGKDSIGYVAGSLISSRAPR